MSTSMAADPRATLIALDFDGTLSPIVDDPAQAWIHPRSLEALQRLGAVVAKIAIVTGRPIDQARRLGRFDAAAGLENLSIYGQYGEQRWHASTGESSSPPRPPQVDALASVLPDWLAERQADHLRIEDKELAIALHTRGLAPGLLSTFTHDLFELADTLGLHAEPGREVFEFRVGRMDKGMCVAELVELHQPDVVIYAGDDLGDLPAFKTLTVLRDEGLNVHLICSASDEQDALQAWADEVLDGPEAVATWLTGLADQFEAASS